MTINKSDSGYKLNADMKDEAEELFKVQGAMKETRPLIERLNAEIKNRRQAEDALRESERRFIDALHSSRDAVVLMSTDSLVDCNDVTVEMFRYASREAFLKTPFSNLFPVAQTDSEDSLGKMKKLMEIALGQGLHRFEWVYRKADGEEFPAQVSLVPIVMRGRMLLYCVLTDLSRKKNDEQRLLEAQQSLKDQAQLLEDALKDSFRSREILASMLEDNNQIREDLERHLLELRRSQTMLINSEKLASLGRLVSEIAHEVNNPLMIISGNAQLSLMSEEISGEDKNNLEVIVSECQRAKNVIRRILRFARPSKGDIKEVEINQSIEAVVGILEKQFMSGSHVEIKRNFLKKVVCVHIDEQQLQEVFMNLLNNAREAMTQGG
ncbi:MAG: PAS domain-containing protein, partial [Candidatus Omnitrophica bacterium]|nr:PAS domain-containing protein [Candidatus Omnitrophota bacterium]